MQLHVFSLAKNNTQSEIIGSHIGSKGKLQSGIDAGTNSCFNLIKAFKKFLSKSNTKNSYQNQTQHPYSTNYKEF